MTDLTKFLDGDDADRDSFERIPSPPVTPPAAAATTITSATVPIAGLREEKILLYLLRSARPSDRFKIRGYFNNDIKFYFDPLEPFDEKDTLAPYIYIAEISVEVEGMNRCYIVHKEKRYHVNSYKLCLSRKVPKLDTTFRDYPDDKERYLAQSPLQLHQFLFDVRFSRHMTDSPPGEAVPYWNQFCLFTYYLLRYGKFDLFDALVKQFLDSFHRDHHVILRDELSDFFQCCMTYLGYPIAKTPDQHLTDLIIIRMTGFLQINRTNLDFNSSKIATFPRALMHNLNQQHGEIFARVTDDDWSSFRDGLSFYLVVQLVLDRDNDAIRIIERITDPKRRQELANLVLTKLEFFNQFVKCKDWTKLLSLVDPKDLTFKQLELTQSIETYLLSLVYILQNKEKREYSDQQIMGRFDGLIYSDHLIVDLPSIYFMLQFIDYEKHEQNEADKRILKFVNRVLEESLAVRGKVKQCLYNVGIVESQFDEIRLVLSCLGKTNILYLVTRVELLNQLMKNTKMPKTSEFFKKWFYAFLVFNEEMTQFKKLEYLELLKNWSKGFSSDHRVLTKMLQDLDAMIDAFQHEQCRLVFIDFIVEMCFQQTHLFGVIGNGLLSVHHPQFLKLFKKRFAERNREINPERFKNLYANDNPLAHLLPLYDQTKGGSVLVKDLIQLSSDKIQLTGFEIVYDTFDQPSSQNFVYRILFHPAFQSSKLRQIIVDQLLGIWNTWEDQGFRGNQISRWHGYNQEEKRVAQRIWEYVGEVAKKQFQIDALIEQQRQEMDEKIQIKTQINLCLEQYCQHASDRNLYQEQLDAIEKKLKSEILRFVEIPNQIKELVPVAQRLNPLSNLHAWKVFRGRSRRNQLQKGTSAPMTTNSAIVDEDALLENKSSAQSRSSLDSHTSLHGLGHQTIDDLPADQRPCLVILQDSIRILDEFIVYWKHICDQWEKAPICDLLSLFPDMKHVTHDFEILKSLNNFQRMDDLKSILDYWKDRKSINNICHGWMDLLDSIHASPGSKVMGKLAEITQMKPTTPGLKCAELSQFFSNEFQSKYSRNLLTFIAEYHLCHDLIAFLNTLSPEDVDNLLLGVNDWDETLINTKTVLDFVLLKRFFVRFDESVRVQLNDNKQSIFISISMVFEKIMEDEQFANLIAAFRVCNTTLTAIKRIHLELTDKESAKRKRISDLMRDMTFSFINKSNQFDIHLPAYGMIFSDLSELRDRARLMEYSVKNSTNLERDPHQSQSKEIGAFVTFVEIVEKVLKNLGQLNLAGHPGIVDYLEPKKTFVCAQSCYDELVQFSLMLDDLLYDWEIYLYQMYEKYIDLTYFIYQQIWIVEDYIYNHLETGTKNHAGYHLLKFIDIGAETIRFDLLPERPTTPNERLANMGKILSAQRTKSTMAPTINSAHRHKRVFVVETTDQGILRAILSLFKHTQTPASVNHLLYCTIETSWTEIRAFVYRCFFAQTMHQLIRPENLSASIQDSFTRLLRQLMENYPQQIFQLGVITNSSNANLQLINGLRTLQIVQLIQDQSMLNQNELSDLIKQMIGNDATLVTSRIDGLGKSHFIRKEIEKAKKIYIKFPISGEIDTDQIASRLQETSTELALSKAALHIDIGPINQIQQLNELIYCLLLFRRSRLKQIAISIPFNAPIYIEWDSSPTYQPLFDKVLVFQCMPRKHFDHIDWNDFDLFDPAKIQFVVKYLLAIKDNSISRKDITVDDKTPCDRTQCINALKSMFPEQDNPDFTWIQLFIFVSIYYRLFHGFSCCGYFLCQSLPNTQLRKDLLDQLLKSVRQFTSLSVGDVRKNQRAVYVQDANHTFSEAIVRWDKTQPFTLVFSASDDPIFVYKNPDDVPQTLVEVFQASANVRFRRKKQETIEFFPDYTRFTHAQFFKRLASLSNKYLNKSICTKCFRQYEYKATHCVICQPSVALVRSKSFDDKDIDAFQQQMADQIESEYVFTPDNFIKMLLIYLRVQSRIPVLIMGETGCGKTALIQCLCQKILDDEMAIFRIHAGVTSEDIIAHFHEYCEQALLCQREGKRLWVFLDEFNTTPNIGLIKELTCERTLLGQSLPDNLVLLGACNPQRRKNQNTLSDQSGVGIKKDLYEMQRLKENAGISLLYTVVPIPETMLEFIWDYGYLGSHIEEKYIRTMLNTCHDLKKFAQWFDRTVNLIAESQKFFRDFEDVSSVSLRDVARFCRLYNWYRQSILDREGTEKFQKSPTVLLRRATLMALFLCYYFRLSTPNERRMYTKRIQDLLTDILPQILEVPDYLLKILEFEQTRLVERMELPAGTAKNRALMDNIFVLLVSVVNRIPVVICGKPGCSKTSAVQIVMSNLRGKKSLDPYFQSLPELITVSFQGSQNCTSDSIIKVFQRADKYLDVEKEKNLLPVIVFDEIGLAELSPHNPLKVLHSKLEVETCQYGFVGLSNWRLDASKMNRALYLSCPDPTVEDLQLTAKIISQAVIDSNELEVNRIDSRNIEALALAYHQLYEHLNQREQLQYRNYFGLRDFYSLIKGVVNDLIHFQDPYPCIRNQLTVNFDGVVDGAETMWKDFCEQIKRDDLIEQHRSPTFKELIDQRLQSRQGRYLMLIAENESVIDYVERYILVKHQPPPVRTLIGSCFSDDLISGTTYTEQYNYRVLMDIILYAETNVTLVMRRMGHLYDNLYDLFNQNFAVAGKKRYCRIALGALYHPRCLVHDDFYCVVFVRKEDLAKCDPPFLNRFEKHLINIQSLVHARHWILTQKLLSDLIELLATNMNKYFPLLQHLFVDYSPDYICNLVIDAFDSLKLTIDDETNTPAVMNYCYEKLLRTSSFDLPLFLSLKSDENHHPWIDAYYNIHSQVSLASLINEALNQDHLPHQIIYTYTQLFHPIDHLSTEVVEVLNLNSFKTESELTTRIKQHYQRNGGPRLLLLRLDYHQEHEFVLLVKHILLNVKVAETNRGVWLICHLQRNLLNQVHNDVLFNGWSTRMINDLNHPQLVPKNALVNPSYRHLVRNGELKLTPNMFNELIDRCLTKFRYTVAQEDRSNEINMRRNQILEYLTQVKTPLRQIIEERVEKLIDTIEFPRFNDWRHDVLTNAAIIGTCRSVNDALHSVISNYYETYLLLLIAHLEKHSFIDTYLFMQNNETHRARLEEIWMHSFESSLNNLDTNSIHLDIIEIPLILGLRLPCMSLEYKLIEKIRQSVDGRRAQDIQEDDLMSFVMKQLRSQSHFGSTMIETILQHNDLFQLYYHDHLLLAQAEGKLHGLSIEFMELLFMSNPTRSIDERLKHLLIDWNEFFTICRLFEIGFRLINESKFIQSVLKSQFLVGEDKSAHRNDTDFYQLVFTSEHFYVIPPRGQMDLDDPFDCEGDPFIEVSLMNLIEYLVSQTIIDHIENIEQLTTIYSLIGDGIPDLDHYSVNNLEKLRSFISLLRCITSLVSPDQALIVFRQACSYAGFDATFGSCQDIHRFIEHLTRIIKNNQNANQTEALVQQGLLKLESEFIKNWLVDHADQYAEVLALLSRPENELWKYSAKILSYIDRKLALLSTIAEDHGLIPLMDDQTAAMSDEIRDLLERYTAFDEEIKKLNDPLMKVEHIFVTRLHMRLMFPPKDSVQLFEEEATNFEENLNHLRNLSEKSGMKLIGLLAWLKYYAQHYAYVLINNHQSPALEDIDKVLTSDESPCSSTVKLFIIKQFCQMSNISLQRLREVMTHRTITWIKPIIALPTGQKTQEIRREIILPTPLFDCHQEFLRVDQILTQKPTLDDLRKLIRDCRTQSETAYSVLLWFIHFYARFSIGNDSATTTPYHQWIQTDLNREVIESFELIGYKFLILLCTNFNNTSYFCLNPRMKPEDIHSRLVLLNLIAVLFAFRSCLLFDSKGKMPENYTTYLQNSVCLPGLLPNDPVVKQMIRVRREVKERLDNNQIHQPGKFIFQCSEKCLYTFYFENCGVPVARSRCPLCNSDIGAANYGVLLPRHPPQIQRPIEEAFTFIDQYLREYERKPRFGYHDTTVALHSHNEEKSEHLNRPISYRFMHFLTHSALFFLEQVGLLAELPQPNPNYFREHVEKDYALLNQQLGNIEQPYIWFYKVFNHLANKKFWLNIHLNSNERVTEFEKNLEENLIFKHLQSIVNEITQYKTMYAQWIQKENEKPTIEHFVDETAQDPSIYPLLSFFNKTNIYTNNPIDEFYSRLQTIPSAELKYPVTSFLMKRLNDYANIQYLYPIIKFTNYLIEKYNHLIKRNDAAEYSIEHYLKQDPDSEAMRKVYEEFLDAWYGLKLGEVRYDCQTTHFKLDLAKEDFAQNTKLAMLLLNTSKDDSGILLAGCLRTIGDLQNEIVHFFNRKVLHQDLIETRRSRKIHIQSIRPEHSLHLDRNIISDKLITDGLTINYQYGQGGDIIYDYEEIELTLSNCISCLPLIDTEKFRCLNYQFELYSENTSLITDVRARVQQEPLDENEQKKLKNLLLSMANDHLLHYLASLDYVFTYLRNIDPDHQNGSIPIQTFAEKSIRSNASLSEYVLQRPPFATIQLRHIIDLYELIEEYAFDRVLRPYVKQNLAEESFPAEQRLALVRQFSQMTWKHERTAPSLQTVEPWIGILKRLMIRVLSNTNISVDVPIQLYLDRTDLWPGKITLAAIQSFEVDESILLQHTFVLLKGLEDGKNNQQADISETQPVALQNTETQVLQTRTWYQESISNASRQSRVLKTEKQTGKKIR